MQTAGPAFRRIKNESHVDVSGPEEDPRPWRLAVTDNREREEKRATYYTHAEYTETVKWDVKDEGRPAVPTMHKRNFAGEAVAVQREPPRPPRVGNALKGGGGNGILRTNKRAVSML